jgi:hypothetical protein
MMNRLLFLFSHDAKSRWRIVLVSAIGFALTGFAYESSGSRLNDATNAAMSAGGLFFFGQLIFYVVGTARLRVVSRSLAFGRRKLRREIILAVCVSLLITASSPGVAANVLNRRLRASIVTVGSSGSLQAAARGVRTLEIANSFNVSLNPSLVTDFRNRVTEAAAAQSELSDLAWRSAQASLEQKTLQPRLRSLIHERRWVGGAEWLKGATPRNINGLEYEGTKSYFTEVEKISDCWGAFYIGTKSPQEEIGVRSCPQFRLIVGNLRTAPPLPELDGFHFRNIIFQNVHVVYNGGPLVMENVAFIDCEFEMPENNQTKRLTELVAGNDVISAVLP